jgi:predicted alpha/beta hydrolase
MDFEEIVSDKNQVISTITFRASKVSALIIIVPATGVKQSYYQKFAEYLSQHSVTVITFDYCGIGDSLKEPIRNIQTSAHDWGADNLEAVITYAKKIFPQSSIGLLGHSIGGQLIGLAKSSLAVDKIILVASQSGYWKFWKGFAKYRMWANWQIVFPTLIFLFGYFPSKTIGKMENLPNGVALQWRRWCISPNYLFDDIEEEKTFHNRVTTNVISISIEDDYFAPKEAVDWLTSKYANAKIERKHISLKEIGAKQVGHFGFFSSKSKDTLWQLLLKKIR